MELPEIVELAEDIFLKPARIGIPDYSGHLKDVLRNPKFATSIGLLKEGRAQMFHGQEAVQGKVLGSVFEKMREWFMGNF